jgi:uncharacterized protein YejL (UPF0352 family)
MTWKMQSAEPEEATVYSPNIYYVTEIGGELSACQQKHESCKQLRLMKIGNIIENK